MFLGSLEDRSLLTRKKMVTMDYFLVAEILGRLERRNKDFPSVPDFSHVISVHLYPNFVRLVVRFPCN